MSLGRTLLRFGVAIQAVLLLTVQIVDGSGVHRCPDHDSGVGVLLLAGPAATGHHHGGHGNSHQHEGLCPCLGACHGTSAALAPAGATAFALAPSASTAGAPDCAPRNLRSQVPHLLPFALGPPALA